MEKYGYVRVSSRDQNIDRQMIALQNEGLKKNQIFIDKESGKDFKRNGYKKMVRKLKDGDQLFVKSIDRLGRNYEEILKEWNYITKDIKADIVILDFPLLDTRKQVNGVATTTKTIQVTVKENITITPSKDNDNKGNTTRPGQSSGNNNNKKNVSSPKTGDATQTGLFALLLSFSGMLLGLLKRKKEN